MTSFSSNTLTLDGSPAPVVPQCSDEQAEGGHSAAASSVDDVCGWLRQIGLHHHVDAFRENGVNGHDLADITNEDLSYMGVKLLRERKIIMRERGSISGAIAADAAPPPVPSVAAVRYLLHGQPQRPNRIVH